MVRERPAGRRFWIVLLALVCVALGWIAGTRWMSREHANGIAPGATSAPTATLWTCSMHPQVIQDHPGTCPICHMALTPLVKSPVEGALAIDPVVVQSMGVRTARVVRGGARRLMRAYGTFAERTPDHRDITLRVAGRIEELYASVDGAPVARGAPLFALSSPELSVAIADLIAARKQQEGDHRDDPDALGATLFEAARSRLQLFGLDDILIDSLARLDAPPASVTFTSPVSGHAIAIAGYAGSVVQADTRILTIADNHALWLDLQVAPADVARVEVGSVVHAHVDGYSGEGFEGRIAFVHPHVDMQTRTALLRVEIDNADMRLREGQWASAEIEIASNPEALYVPREAVIDTGLRAVVFVALGQGRFEPRVVVLGEEANDGLLEIASGLSAGEDVVSSGQFLLDSESRLREAVRKFLAPDARADAQPDAVRPAWAGAVDTLVERYLQLADALGQPETNAAPVDAEPFVAAARDLARRAGTDARVAAVVKSAEPLEGAKLAQQRELFKQSSDALLELVTRVPPSVAVGGSSLYVMNCPMAPGRWLQRDPVVKNPFYGTTMKACGEVVRPLLLEPEHKQ